jgi:hypothetical protein
MRRPVSPPSQRLFVTFSSITAQAMVLPLLRFLAIGTGHHRGVPQGSLLAHALADLLSRPRVSTNEGSWDGGRTEEEFWAKLGSTESRPGPERGSPTETSVKRVYRWELEFIISVWNNLITVRVRLVCMVERSDASYSVD